MIHYLETTSFACKIERHVALIQGQSLVPRTDIKAWATGDFVQWSCVELAPAVVDVISLRTPATISSLCLSTLAILALIVSVVVEG